MGQGIQTRPRRTLWQAARATPKTVRSGSIRKIRHLYRLSHWHLVVGLAAGLLSVLVLLGAIAIVGIAATSVGVSRTTGVVIFVATTIATSLIWSVLGWQPWMIGVNLLLWLHDPPPGTAIVNVYVDCAAGASAADQLLAAGFDYVEERREMGLEPHSGGFPTTCIAAWDVRAGGDSGAAIARATSALTRAGVRHLPNVSAQVQVN